MHKYCQLLNGKAYWIFEQITIPQFAPNIVIKDITGNTEIKEGWDYNSVTGVFSAPIIIPEVIPIIQPSNQDVIDGQLVLMDVMATLYEDMKAKGTV